MSFLKKMTIVMILIFLVFGTAYILIDQYSIIFSKTISGKLLKVSRFNNNIAIMGSAGAPASSQIFSSAIAIKADDGIIYTASSEDRQWEAVSEGNCVKARLQRYPPWNFEKAGTFFQARLLETKECP